MFEESSQCEMGQQIDDQEELLGKTTVMGQNKGQS